MPRESVLNTFRVAVLLCLVCSVVVSSLAVGLRDTQQTQKETFRQQNILAAAGLWDPDSGTAQEARDLYERSITPVVVDLETGRVDPDIPPDDPRTDPRVAARDSRLHTPVTELGEGVRDIARIRRREHYSTIYEVREDGRLKTVILPIRGYGLWSTLWGFIALDVSRPEAGPEGITVRGLSFYAHGETPGLGGEVENPLWKAKWPGKRVYDADWNVLIEVSKSAASDHQVDALSGATITSNGVTSMLRFWLGEYGFGPYLRSLLESAANSTLRTAGIQVSAVP